MRNVSKKKRNLSIYKNPISLITSRRSNDNRCRCKKIFR